MFESSKLKTIELSNDVVMVMMVMIKTSIMIILPGAGKRGVWCSLMKEKGLRMPGCKKSDVIITIIIIVITITITIIIAITIITIVTCSRSEILNRTK